MSPSTRSESLLRGLRQGVKTARLVILSMFLPTKILTDMVEADRAGRSGG